ncbi:hypothetical protein [Sphingobium xenophagum]|uniref:hypothetical protein n=1 Tax=Sphingobium xenophagum TaxID=121428 RepID=UPI001C0C015A|nr:hypothetical protein [Sphingobium xenophagum]QWT16577.1 hypothetical protein GTV57_20595 [Sphingobium xenophagum]
MLDDAGHDIPAGHLKLALDMAEKALAEDHEPEAMAETDILVMDPRAVRALGGAFAVIGTVLARSNIVPMRELADILAIYAATTSESDPPQGLLIACWAGILKEAADYSEKA